MMGIHSTTLLGLTSALSQLLSFLTIPMDTVENKQLFTSEAPGRETGGNRGIFSLRQQTVMYLLTSKSSALPVLADSLKDSTLAVSEPIQLMLSET